MSTHASKVKSSSNHQNVEIGGLLETLRPLGGILSEHGFALLKTASGEFDFLVLDPIGKVLRATRSSDNPNTWVLKNTGLFAIALASAQDAKTALDNGIFAIQRSGKGHIFQRLVYDIHRDHLDAIQVSDTFFSNPKAKKIVRFQVRRSREATDTFHLMAGIERETTNPNSNPLVNAYQHVSGDQRNQQPGGWLWWSRESDTEPDKLLLGSEVQLFGEFHQGRNKSQLLAIGNVPEIGAKTQSLHLQGPLEPCGFNKFLTVATTGTADLRKVKGATTFTAGEGMMTATNPEDCAPVIFKLQRSGDGDQFPFGQIWSVAAQVSQTGDLSFPNNWEKVPSTTHKTEKQNFTTIHAIQTSSEAPIDLFMINRTNRLWHMRRSLDGAWSIPVDLGIQATGLTHGFEGSDPKNPNALIVIVGDRNTGELTEMRRRDDGWDIQTITLSLGEATRFVPVRECVSTLVMYDKNGAVLPGALVEVRTTDDQDVAALVNGTSTLLTSKTGFQTMTDGSGAVTIRSRVTGAFGAPTFTIEPDERFEGAETVNATTDLHAFMSKITKTQITGARDPATGKTVVNLDKDQTKNVTDALHASMSASRLFFPKSAIRKGIAEIEFKEGEVRTRKLKSSDFEDLRSQAHSEIQKGFLSTPSWGDLWQAIEGGIYRVEKIVVKAGQSIAEVIVKVGKTFWRYVVTNASQAFDIAWGVLRHVGAKLQETYNWLLDQFNSFNLWSDIVHNKNWIKAELNGSIDLQASEISRLLSDGVLRQMVESAKSDKTNWKNLFESALTDSGKPSDLTVGGLQNNSANWHDIKLPKHNGTNLPLAPLHSFNWFIDEALQALTNIKDLSKNIFPKSLSAVEDLVNKLGSDIVKAADDAISPLEAEFQNWLQNPTELSTKGLANLLNTTAFSVLGSFIKTGDDLIVGVAGVGQAVGQDVPGTLAAFDTEIKLPYLTDFYEDVLNAGDSNNSNVLSILDLVALILAIPSTRALGRIDATKDSLAVESKQDYQIAATVVGMLAAKTQVFLDSVFDLARFASKVASSFIPAGSWLANLQSIPRKGLDTILFVFSALSWLVGLVSTGFMFLIAAGQEFPSIVEFALLAVGLLSSTFLIATAFVDLVIPLPIPVLVFEGVRFVVLAAVMGVAVFFAAAEVRRAAEAKGNEKTAMALMSAGGFLQTFALFVQGIRLGADQLVSIAPTPFRVLFVIWAYIAFARFPPFFATGFDFVAMATDSGRENLANVA